MGSGKRIVVSATGFPGTNKTWRFIQDAWREPLNALALLSGNKTILSGVEVAGGNVSNGFIAYNGEILPFVGGATHASVTLIEETETVNYDVDIDNDGQQDNLPAYKTRYFKPGTEGVVTFPFTDLKRLKTVLELSEFELPDGVVIDATYIKFTQAMLDKLNSIDFGAEVNVQANWNEASSASDAYILNKPFTELRITSGTLTCNTLEGGQQQDNSTKNKCIVYPPAGFTVSHLKGFMPTLSEVYFDGYVNNDDTMWCNYQINYGSNNITIYANNSEYRAAPRIHYLAIWIKN